MKLITTSSTHDRLLLLALVWFWLSVWTGNASAQVMDAVGDHDNQADIVEIDAMPTPDGSGMRMRLTYAAPIQPPLVGYVFIDVDRDPTTGAPTVSPVPGIDALVKYTLTDTGRGLQVRVEVSTASGMQIFFPPKTDKMRFKVDGNVIRIGLLGELFGGVSVFDFFVATDTGEVGDTVFDRVPDFGVIDYAGGSAQWKVPQPGDDSIDLVVSDALQEVSFPDLATLTLRVIGDRLDIMLSYNHDLDDRRLFPRNGQIIGQIYLDGDRRLATGFANGGLSPPLMGADEVIRFTIHPQRPLAPVLIRRPSARQQPVELGFGLAFANDCMAWRQGRNVHFQMPLSLLAHPMANAFFRVDSLLTSTREIDALPDDGALVLGEKRVQAPFRCDTEPVDARPESEPNPQQMALIGARACLSLSQGENGDIVLLSIDYTRLSPNPATVTTNVYLDSDQDPLTGSPVSNADTTIGADYVLTFSAQRSFPNAPLSTRVELQESDGRPLEIEQLIHFDFGQPGLVTVSLPLSLLDDDDGNMDIMIETRDEESRLEILPARGLIRLRRN